MQIDQSMHLIHLSREVMLVVILVVQEASLHGVLALARWDSLCPWIRVGVRL